LLDANDVFLRETNTIPDDSVLIFKRLNPGTYRLKVFIDSNGNNEWDTGNLKEMKQPETVIFYPKALEVKSGWEMEYEWKIK